MFTKTSVSSEGDKHATVEEDVDEITRGYDALPNRQVADRIRSEIKGLKGANNWIKKTLISDYTRRGDVVLDLCCGKGGDMHKWTDVNPSRVVFVDIAAESVKQCRQRFEETLSGTGEVKKKPRYEASFHVADCFAPNFLEYLPPGLNYDVVSCQMAFHYCFASQERANCSMKSISRVLKPGGYFICTVPDSEVLVARLLKVPPTSPEPLKFGNSIYQVVFDSRTEFPWVGSRYRFTLKEAVDDIPEYLVKCKHLCGLANSCGLKLVKTSLFEDFLEENKDRHGKVSIKLSPDEREVFSIYRTYVFHKE